VYSYNTKNGSSKNVVYGIVVYWTGLTRDSSHGEVHRGQ